MEPRPTEGYTEQKTIALGFDGVIHSATSGWTDFADIPDEPSPGVRQALAEFKRRGFRVVVYTTRAITVEGFRAVLLWLVDNGLTDLVDQVCKNKPVADVYVDKKAVRFEGFDGLLDQIEKVIEETSE